MMDEGLTDHKIIAVPLNDPVYYGIRCLADLPHHISDEMMHFFSVYKALEGKETSIESVGEVEEAVKVIEEDMAVYQQKLLNGDFHRNH